MIKNKQIERVAEHTERISDEELNSISLEELEAAERVYDNLVEGRENE